MHCPWSWVIDRPVPGKFSSWRPKLLGFDGDYYGIFHVYGNIQVIFFTNKFSRDNPVGLVVFAFQMDEEVNLNLNLHVSEEVNLNLNL